MKRLKKILKLTGLTILGLIIILVVVYLLGPKGKMDPIDNLPLTNFDVSISALETWLKEKETKVEGLRPDNEAQIIWADSSQTQSDYSIVYLHGFSASQGEASPMHQEIAQYFGANLFLARLQEHGISRADAMLHFNPKDYLQSAKEAIAIGKLLGKKVILLSCSTGASAALYLAAKDPNIESVIALSPNCALADPNSFILSGPWGLQIARMMMGGKNRSWANERLDQPQLHQYWTDS